MREFPGGVGNVGFDRFEHGAKHTGSGIQKPEGKKTFDADFTNSHENKGSI